MSSSTELYRVLHPLRILVIKVDSRTVMVMIAIVIVKMITVDVDVIITINNANYKRFCRSNF